MKMTDVIRLVKPKCSLAITYKQSAKVCIVSSPPHPNRFLEGIIEHRCPSSSKTDTKLQTLKRKDYELIKLY